MRAVIIKGKEYGTVDGVLKPTKEIRRLINSKIKAGLARLLIDTDETLMYELI